VVASDIFGVSGRAMLAALILGERDPRRLAALARTRLRAKRGQLQEAFTGQFSDHHAFLLATMLGRVDQASADVAELDRKIEAEIAPFGAAVERLDEICGVGRTAAQAIIAEIGTDMARFPTPGHLASWARYAPGVKQSAGKAKGRATTRHGNPYLARVLGEAAVAAGRTDTFLGERYRRIARRRGTKKAIVAVGRSILVIVWHLLADPNLRYHDLGPGFTTPTSTPSAPNATTSASWRPWATGSPWYLLPDRHPSTGLDPAPLRSAGCCRLPANRGFSDQRSGASSGPDEVAWVRVR
jgi:transposase